MNILIRLIFLFFTATVSVSAAVSAQALGKEEAALPYDFAVEWGSISPEKQVITGVSDTPAAILWLQPKDGYHTYAHLPGEGALPTTVSLEGDGGAARILYLPGLSKSDVFDPEVMVRVYEGRTPVFLLFPSGLPALPGKLKISMLACSDSHCFPVDAVVELPNPGENRPWDEARLELLRQAVAAEPVAALATPAETTGEEGALTNSPPASLALAPERAAVTSAPDESSGDASGNASGETSGVAEDEWNLTPQPYHASLEVSGLGKAMLLGLFAGLILNFMPCVLPVITLKISALLAVGGEAEDRRRRFREHNLLFSAGILTWFCALALLFSFADLAWGQLFQNRAVILIMLLLVFCLGLSMFDVFHLPVLDLRLGGKTSSPRVQAYSTGLLATLLATPCSGPLLGGVLGWSLMQSLPILLTVFMATGVGMSLPYLAMAWKPDFANRLPRPGPWMQVCERLLGFLLMGTAVYLLSILPTSMVFPALSVLVVAAAAAWIWGKWGSLRGTAGHRLFVGTGCLLLVAVAAYFSFSPASAHVEWKNFQVAEFKNALGKKPLLVEFTADWCPTCQILEKTALTSENLAPLQQQYGLELIRVDMTEHDADAQSLLRALGSASIPLLAVFPEGARSPVVLRDLYTAGQLKDAVRQALKDRE